jgi:hypothetical protein
MSQENGAIGLHIRLAGFGSVAVIFLKFIFLNFFKSYRPVPWQDSISRPIAPISSVAGGDDTTRPCRQDNVPGIFWVSFIFSALFCRATEAPQNFLKAYIMVRLVINWLRW